MLSSNLWGVVLAGLVCLVCGALAGVLISRAHYEAKMRAPLSAQQYERLAQ